MPQFLWGYDGANRLGTPPRLYNQIIRQVAMNVINPATGQINGEGENARLFAFVNAAMGDAGILAWEQKYCHDFWRPVVGVIAKLIRPGGIIRMCGALRGEE
jgi:vanadium chloroperoxidase